MTKDYYKILSIKSDSTDEEIRTRWIELVKSYHIDFDMGEFDERVKDINDAYHVLKNPATRLEYDLERTFEGKKNKGAHLSKWVLRAGLAVVLVALGVIYFENPESPHHLIGKSQAVSAFPKTEQRLPVSEPQKPPVVQVAGQETSASGQASSPLQPQQEALPGAAKPAETGSDHQAKKEETGPPVEKVNLRKVAHPASETHSARQPADTNKASQTNRLQRILVLNSSSSKNAEGAPIQRVTKIAQVNASSPNSGKSTPTEPENPSALLAREDEVKEFSLNYTKAYTRVDVNAFLAQFSLRVVQNREESFEDLRRTYRRFFSQSQELQYQLQDLKFEIYKNGVEATARYVLDQISKRNGAKQTWRGTIRWVLTREEGVLKIISLDYKHQESL
jgi:curved DNA-binding protein CbpA